MSGTAKPRFVFLNHWASRLGGAEYSLLDILAHAAPLWECHLVSAEGGELHRRACALGITCHVVACGGSMERIRRWNLLATLLVSWKEWLHFAAYLLKLRRLVLKLRPDLVHANVPKSHVALFLLCRIGYRGPACFHMREIFGCAPNAASVLYGLLFPRSRAFIIAISQAVAASLPTRCRRNASVIYNGVAVADGAGVRKGFDGTLRLVYLGRIVPWKGCHTLVRILHKARCRYVSTPVELDLIGDTAYWPDEYRQTLVSLIVTLGLSGCCRLLPHTDDIDAMFGTHDVFCNASLREPFGRSIAEAQAHGLPVVAFASGGIAEIVVNGETGVLVPYGDEDAFVEALGRFINQPGLLSAMGEKGRCRMRADFNRAVQIPRICACMEKHLGGISGKTAEAEKCP